MTNFESLETLEVALKESIAWVTLNRPEVKNAMSFKMVTELQEVFSTLRDNRQVRCIVLSGAGNVFCSGGDINDLRDAFNNPAPDSNAAVNMDAMLQAANTAPQVVIAVVEGVAMGGGFGLVCVSDIAIATEEARFALPEVRLGLAPSFISPYVIERLGLPRARELMLTGRRFNGIQAQQYGLVHYAVSTTQLDEAVQKIITEVCQGGPNALAACKALIFEVAGKDTAATVDYRANLLNELRLSSEAQEGMLAFVQKRPAKWAATKAANKNEDGKA